MIDISCFDDIIGLSDTDCTACFPTAPAGYGTSESGLYLDELIPLKTSQGLENCEDGDLWDIMTNARTRAILNFVSDANGLLLKNNELVRKRFDGQIGRSIGKTARSIQTDYAGVRMFCADVRSGVAVLKGVGTLLDTTGTITLNIFNNLGDTVHTETLNTVANTYTPNVLAAEVELPLHSDEVENLDYFFVYELAGKQPMNNEIKWCCGSWKPTFDCRNPYFNKIPNQRFWWASYAMVGGYTTNDITDFSDLGYTADNYMNGLTLDIEFKCKTTEVFCYDSLDFTDPTTNMMAFAIRFKAAEIMVNALMTTPELNRFIMINRESFDALKAEWATEYENYLGYIVDNINIQVNDCFKCKDKYRARRAGLLS